MQVKKKYLKIVQKLDKKWVSQDIQSKKTQSPVDARDLIRTLSDAIITYQFARIHSRVPFQYDF